MSKGWGKARIPSPWGHFAGSITSVWHSQADFCCIPAINSELCLAWKKILAGKNSVSARLNYLWILRNTRCLRENLRKFVQPSVRKPRRMRRHSQQPGHASEVWHDLDFLLSFIFCPRSEPWCICTLLLFPQHCWMQHSITPLLVCTSRTHCPDEKKAFKNFWGLNIIFKLIQEILYICPEFRISLIWDGSKWNVAFGIITIL